MSGSEPLSILVISADAAVRAEAVAHFNEAAGSGSICYEGETAARGIDLAAVRRPRAVVVDLRSEPEEMLRVAERVREQSPGSRLVGLYDPLQPAGAFDLPRLFLEGIRKGCSDFLRLPLSPEESSGVFRRLLPAAGADGAAGKGRVTGFFSNKGGVGKTTLTVNTAVAMARAYPGEVAVVDGSLEVGSVADFLNLKPEKTLFHAVEQRGRLDPELLRSLMTRHEESGLWVLPCPKSVHEVVRITEDDVTQVLLVARAAFKQVVVDTYPIFNALSLAIGDLSDSVVVVAEGIVPSVNATRDLLDRLREAGYPESRIRAVLNKYARFRGNVEPQLVAEALQRPVDWVLPYDKVMHVCANLGRPYLLESPGSSLAGKIESMSAALAGAPVRPAASRPLWKRLLGRGS